jgi:sulfate adenylyltransferase
VGNDKEESTLRHLIKPHGGVLVNRVLGTERRVDAKAKALTLPRLHVRRELRGDAENIARGVYSPLEGFLGRADFESVLARGRLCDGLPWTVPIVLDAALDEARALPEGGDVALVDESGSPFALMHVTEKYECNKNDTAAAVFGTTDGAHPGVARLFGWGDVLLAGPLDLIEEMDNPFADVTLEPRETRVLFAEKGWKSVVAFQTRNVPHAGHENLQKTVLGLVDGLLIQPVIGKKKRGDYRDDVIIEAIRIFEGYPDLEIKPVTVRGDFFYCKKCRHLASERTCPHEEEYHIPFSGTEIRRMIAQRRRPPEEIMRPEVFEVLMHVDSAFIE